MSKPLDGTFRYVCFAGCRRELTIHVAQDDDLPVMFCPDCGKRMDCTMFTPDGPHSWERGL